jgi:hypothetical protein
MARVKCISRNITITPPARATPPHPPLRQASPRRTMAPTGTSNFWKFMGRIVAARRPAPGLRHSKVRIWIEGDFLPPRQGRRQ